VPVDLVVRLDAGWIELPVTSDQDSGDWAKEAVAQGLKVRGVEVSGATRSLYTQAWAAVLDNLRTRADAGDSMIVSAYGLVPGTDLLPVTIVEAHVAVLTDGRGVDGLVEDLVAPEESRFGPPDVSTSDSPAGQAVRLKQLLVVEGSSGTDGQNGQVVHTSLAHIWPGPEEGTAILMTAYFDSPMDAELCLHEVDALAGSLDFAELP
jgi:hypothetical protein